METRLIEAIETIRRYEDSVGIGAQESMLRQIDTRKKDGVYQAFAHAADCEGWLSFGDQVDMVMDGEWPRHAFLQLCPRPPEKIRCLGLPALPMSITAKHVQTMHAPYSRDNIHLHGLSIAEIKRLPETAGDFVAAALSTKQRNQDATVLVLDRLAPDGFPVVMVLTERGRARFEPDGPVSHTLHVLSAYGMRGFPDELERAVRSDRLLYMEPKRMTRLMHEASFSLPGAYMSLDGIVPVSQCREVARRLDFANKPTAGSNPPLAVQSATMTQASRAKARAAARELERRRAREERAWRFEQGMDELRRRGLRPDAGER